MSEVTLSLAKGERIDLTKANPSLVIAHVGLGWDVNRGNGDTFDLDAFAMCLNDEKKLASGEQSVLYFGRKYITGLQHMGDNLTGVGDGDDETIKVMLADLPANVDAVLFGVNIYKAESKRQNFGMVNNAYIRIYDAGSNAELIRYDLSEDYSTFTGVLAGKIYRKDGEWKFQAMGEGVNGSINEIIRPY